MSVEKISEHRARYKYLFVNKLSDEKSGLNPLGNCFLYCPLSHSKLNIILFTNYIVIHCRQCGGEWRGLCLFVCLFCFFFFALYYCRILLQNDIPFSLNESFHFHTYKKECYFAIYISCNMMFPIQWSLFSMKSVGTFYRMRWQYCLVVRSWEQLLSYCLHV